LAEVLKALLEDRQLREKELTEERARREEELRRWEAELLEEHARREEELREERRRWDEETARREEEMRRQIELLKGLVEGVQRQGETAALKSWKETGMLK